LNRCGAKEKDIEVFKVPGAFEIPLVAKRWLSPSDLTRSFAWEP